MNSTQRAHIVIPSDLLREIDALVGPRGRTGFLLETAREELRRRKLLNFLASREAASREAHSEEDSAAWVQRLRSEGEDRIEKKQPQAPNRRKRK